MSVRSVAEVGLPSIDPAPQLRKKTLFIAWRYITQDLIIVNALMGFKVGRLPVCKLTRRFWADADLLREGRNKTLDTMPAWCYQSYIVMKH